MACLEGNPLLSKKNMLAQLQLPKLQLNRRQDFGNTTIWTDQTKVPLCLAISTTFGKNQTQRVSINTSHQQSNTVVEERRSGFVLHSKNLTAIESTTSSSVYRSFLELNARQSVQLVKLVTQQDNDQNHGSKSTTDSLKKKRIKLLQ